MDLFKFMLYKFKKDVKLNQKVVRFSHVLVNPHTVKDLLPCIVNEGMRQFTL